MVRTISRQSRAKKFTELSHKLINIIIATVLTLDIEPKDRSPKLCQGPLYIRTKHGNIWKS